MRRRGDCRDCENHRAVFVRKVNGRIRKDRKHDLCMRCYRAYRSSFIATSLCYDMEDR